jgi:hypothetical protein
MDASLSSLSSIFSFKKLSIHLISFVWLHHLVTKYGTLLLFELTLSLHQYDKGILGLAVDFLVYLPIDYRSLSVLLWLIEYDLNKTMIS